MRQLSEREALHKLRRLQEQFDDALAVLESQLAHPDVRSISHEPACEMLGEMRDRLLPLEVGPMPEVAPKRFAQVPEPELTEQVLEGLQISRSKFPALCSHLEEIEVARPADASVVKSVYDALCKHGATTQQANLIWYALEVSAALHAMLAELGSG